jgi:phosphonate transport system permease protein
MVSGNNKLIFLTILIVLILIYLCCLFCVELCVSLINGYPAIISFIGRMFPPNVGRLDSLLCSLYDTMIIAFLGTIYGVIIGFPLSVIGSNNFSYNNYTKIIIRSLCGFIRAVPDIIWGLLFVIWVGIGSFAGILAITINTVGFCVRFISEAIDDVDINTQNALFALGANRVDVFFSAVIPDASPSILNAILYSLERSIRSSVVLGLIGCGGIGIELIVSIETFRYDQVSTIIILILILILIVEGIGMNYRNRIKNKNNILYDAKSNIPSIYRQRKNYKKRDNDRVAY